MTISRHTRGRKQLNEKRTVALILQLCFGLSQKCSFFQVDNGILLRFSHCTNQGLNTQRVIGTSTCSMTVDRALQKFSSSNRTNVISALDDAIKNRKLLLLMIDDYTTIHSTRRPKDLKTSQANNMCTIIFKVFPDIRAITRPPPQFIHNKDGIKPHDLANEVCSEKQMTKLSCTFATCLPELTTSFFDPLLERKRLESHDYGASTDVSSMRKFKNVYLVDFFMQALKLKNDYMEALNRVLNLDKLKEYLSKFVVLFPGDHPSQFYPRQIIYETLCKYIANITSKTSIPHEELLSLVPLIGPLHIDLNADEDLVLNYHPFVKSLYESLFPSRFLAEKPKPWRIQFILEIIYGGWTLIRRTVKAVFSNCKDLQYGTLLNFLDNYCPTVLCSYSILFKTNDFSNYYDSIIRMWVMMYCFRRHHYNKSLLIWLFLVKYWEGNEFCTDIFNLFNNHLNIIDESVVEYVHSVIRRHTKDGASEKTLADTMKAIFGCGLHQENFCSTFTPERNYVFSRVQLKYLHTRVAKILVSFFSKICSSPGESYSLPRSKGQPRDCTMFILPTLFGEKPVKSYMLPLGFQCEKKPDVNSRCDYICVAPEDADWQIFEGCWHSFHKECLKDLTYCPICSNHLNNVILSLSIAANSSFVNGGNQDDLDVDVQTSDSDSDDDSDDELECDNLGINTNESNIENMLNNINLSLMQLRPQSPSNTSVNSNEQCDADSSTILTNVQPPKRSPHFSTCHHTRNGHGKGTSNAKCTMCPDNICSASGRSKPCICHWHISQQNSMETIIPYSVVKFTNVNYVNEYLLSFCQSNMDSQSLGSNACTIIAVLVAINFLSDTAWFSQHHLLSTLDSSFLAYSYQLFTEGNQMYESLDEEQINYCAPEILEHPKLGLIDNAERGEEYQFNNFADFLLELQMLSTTRIKLAFVLIFHPDKSMSLLINELGESMLIDSHSHLDTGAIIATASENKLHCMVNYIQ